MQLINVLVAVSCAVVITTMWVSGNFVRIAAQERKGLWAMATCKDCIHERVCFALIKKGLPYADGEYPAEAFCMAFRNKADVAEVKHGEWVWDERFSDYTCSLCHNWDLTTPNYCSNCGAKMNGTPNERGGEK